MASPKRQIGSSLMFPPATQDGDHGHRGFLELRPWLLQDVRSCIKHFVRHNRTPSSIDPSRSTKGALGNDLRRKPHGPPAVGPLHPLLHLVNGPWAHIRSGTPRHHDIIGIPGLEHQEKSQYCYCIISPTLDVINLRWSSMQVTSLEDLPTFRTL